MLDLKVLSLKTLLKHFGSDELILRPDHPLLLRGPDAIFGSSGNLCALFTPSSIEIRNIAHLASRLIAAKLALPRHCRTVLLIDRHSKDQYSSLQMDFGLTTSIDDRHLASFVRDRLDFGHSRAMEPELQAQAIKLFDLGINASEFAYRAQRIRGRDEVARGWIDSEFQRRSRPRIASREFSYEPHNRIEFYGRSISYLNAKSRQNLLQQIYSTTSGHLLENYTLDRGVPYPNNLIPHFAIAEAADNLFENRSKVIYSTAFAGIVLIPTEDREIILRSFDKIGPITDSFIQGLR